MNRRTRLARITPLRSYAGLARSPWSRSVPLAGTGLGGTGRNTASRTGDSPAAGGRDKSAATGRRETRFSRAVKLQVRTRAGNGDPDEARCEATGVWLGRYGGEIQHRDARGMGGTSDPVTSSIVNAVLLSKEAHRLAESRDEHMNAMGFWLKNGQDPRTEPIMLHGEGGRVTVFLGENGSYLTEAPDVIAA